MKVVSRVARAVLTSRVHPLLSGSLCLIRYRGRRTGRQFENVVQYAADGDDLVILAGRADSKLWWRNFTDARPLDVLVAGRWRPMVGRVIVADDSGESSSAVRAYTARFPRSSRTVGSGATLVVCQPSKAQRYMAS